MKNYWRQIFVCLVCFALIAGCAEDNRYRTTSEADSLANAVQLTGGFERARDAHFSHDMRWIVFAAVPHGESQYQMYLAMVRRQSDDIVGIERPIRISPPNSRNGWGSFSPDGLSLIFASTAGNENESSGSFPKGMRIFRVDGWEEAAAMSDPAKGLDFAQHALTDSGAYDGECSYSPDGKWICFTSSRDGNLNIYVMHTDGSHIVQITKNAGYDGGANFSPDGKRLVYHSDRKGNHQLQIFVGDLALDDHGEIAGLLAEHQLTHDENVNWGPYWHPDNRHVIFSTDRIGPSNDELYLMRKDGLLKTRITFNPGADIIPVFSPDGQYLMWTSKRASEAGPQIFLAKFQFPEGS